MSFINEYILPVKAETSNFARNARVLLNTGHSQFDKWTIDRDGEMVLQMVGRGHDMDSAGSESWKFICKDRVYLFGTQVLNSDEVSAEKLQLVKGVVFFNSNGFGRPRHAVILCIKEALRTFKDYGVISDYKDCDLKLIDEVSGEELK